MQLRWLLLLLFPVGWIFTVDVLPRSTVEFTALTVASGVATAVILTALGRGTRAKLHLWFIIVLFLVGFYAKLFLLLALLQFNSELVGQTIHPLVVSAVVDERVTLATYRLMTAVISALALTLLAMRLSGLLPRHGRLAGDTPQDSAVIARAYSLPFVIGAAIAISVVSLVLQVRFDVGVIRAEFRPLPYKLSSVILFTRTLLVPMMMLFAIWLADLKHRRRASVFITGMFLLDAAGSSFATTSKSNIVLAFVSLLVLWGLTDRLTKPRRRFLLAMAPVVVLMLGVLSASRYLRGEIGVGALEVLPAAVGLLLFSDSGLLSVVSQLLLSALLRVIGVDAVLPIVAQNAAMDVSQAFSTLFVDRVDVNMLYTRDVMGWDQPGLAYSVSLLGFFYFLTGEVWITALGVSLYLLMWHQIFRSAHRFPGSFRPVYLTMLIQTVALTTSEGSIHGLPLHLALVTGVMFGAQWYASWFSRTRGFTAPTLRPATGGYP